MAFFLYCRRYIFSHYGVYAFNQGAYSNNQCTNRNGSIFSSGVFSLISLLTEQKDSWKNSNQLWLSSSAQFGFLCICAIACLCIAPLQLYMCFGAIGLGVGLIDAAVNMQGILFEQRHNQQALNLFHALYSGGSLVLSIIAAIAASAALSKRK